MRDGGKGTSRTSRGSPGIWPWLRRAQTVTPSVRIWRTLTAHLSADQTVNGSVSRTSGEATLGLSLRYSLQPLKRAARDMLWVAVPKYSGCIPREACEETGYAWTGAAAFRTPTYASYTDNQGMIFCGLRHLPRELATAALLYRRSRNIHPNNNSYHP